jgi:hypothetical protein
VHSPINVVAVIGSSEAARIRWAVGVPAVDQLRSSAAADPRRRPTPDRVLAPRAMRYTLVAMSTRNIAIAAIVIVVVVVIIVFVL